MAMTTVRVRYSRLAYSCAWTKRAFAAVAAVLAMTAQAAEVTGDMALAAAQAWSAENRALSGEIGTPVSVKERRGDDGKLLWYEVAMSGGGCVVAAADTEIEPIVAVADRYDGGIPQGHPLEAMLLADMGRRLAVLEGTPVVRQTPKASGLLSASAARAAEVRASAVNASRKWAKLTGRAQDNAKGRLLLKGAAEATTPQTVVRYLPEWASEKLTFWNQFSTYTPSNYVAGCVATAGAALLQFYNMTTAPKVTNDCWVDGEKTSLTTIGIDYDWAKLPEEQADYYSFTAEQKDLAGRAVYDMGVCLGMSYAPDGSSSSVRLLASVLRNDFGLADARYAYSIDATVYDKLIYSQIRAGAPVALGIRPSSGAGHAVVAVGYGVDADSPAYTRIFMGWGGSSDAWYALPNVEDYTMVHSIVTMMGATSETMAVCGRVTTESGKGAAYVDVTVGGKTVVTDESGYWGVRVTPVNGSISCSCAGTTKYVSAGANAVKTDLSYKGATLANDLPDEVNFTIPDSEAITIYTNPSDAVRAALREGKILMVLVGFDGCDYCAKLKDDLKGVGTDFAKDFVAFYANTQINAYGLNDETYTASPYWGTFDPRIWKLEKRWAEDNGCFTISCGYGGSSYTTRLLDSARSQWAARNSAPLSLSVTAPDQITMPTALAAKISFPDGTETAVTVGLSWSVVSGTAATVQAGGLLSPVEGASGDVTIKCEGYFWNTAYSATKTIRIIDGVVAKSLVVEGPEVVDLFNVDGAQYVAKAVLSDGSFVEVPVTWETVEAGSTNHSMSATGYLSFRKEKYSEESSVRLTARYGACSASMDVTVWGNCVKVLNYTLSDACAWPGKTVTLTIDQVQWWRHGAWEEPTDDFSGVGVGWYYYVGSTYYPGGSGTARTISLTVPPDDNGGATGMNIGVAIERANGGSKHLWTYANLQYVSSQPSQLVEVTFDANGGEPALQTRKYAVGHRYYTLPKAERYGYRCDWYTAPSGGTYVSESSDCSAFVTRLYAHWSKKYRYFEYDANGGIGSMEGSWIYYDTPRDLRANSFKKTGSMFLGWSLLPDGPVVYQDKEEIINLNDDYERVMLYAAWLEGGYKIAFDANGGTGDMDSRTCTNGACLAVPGCTFSRTGYVFAGWAETPDGAVKYAAGAQVCGLVATVGATVTLYASWTANTYAVALDQQGGIGGTASVTATYRSAMPSITIPTRFGYRFGGYYTDTNGSGTQYYTASGSSARTWDKTGAATLYAKWVAVPTYAITYMPGANGTGFQQTATKTKDVALTLKDAIFTRTGYTQTGWATRDGGAKAYNLGASYTANAALTLYPFWTAVTPPDPTPGTNPDPTPGPDPDPTPGTDPDPAPGADPDPEPGTDPDPTPGTDPVARPELFEESQPISDPAAVFQAATIWDGWLESRGEVLGTIQAKVAKFTARGAPKVTVSVVEGGRKIGGRGQMEIGADGTVSASCALKDGRTVRLAFGPDELSGTLDGAEIRGARTIFTSRQAADKQTAEAVLARLQRTAVVYWGGNALSVVVAKKGKCKVSGNLASGARVSASSQLVVGEAWCAVPVAYAKRGADVRFLLWMNRATGEIAAEGAGEGVEVQWASVPRETLRFRLDGAFDIPGATVLTQFLPAGEGLAFAGGTKWVLPKGGAVKQDRASGEYVDTKPETGNPSGLKLTYSPKTGAFKGSLKVHAVVNGKLKKYSASVAGIMVGDVGYGTATIKKFPSVEISVR